MDKFGKSKSGVKSITYKQYDDDDIHKNKPTQELLTIYIYSWIGKLILNSEIENDIKNTRKIFLPDY